MANTDACRRASRRNRAAGIGRRQFIALLGGAAASVPLPLAARAQRGERMRRIGVLMSLAESDPEGQARVAALRGGLEKLGWGEGRNIRADIRWAAGDAGRARVYAAELVGLKPEVVVAGATTALGALKRSTETVPIVFAQVPDPVGGGFVASLARPGGNITGFSQYEFAVGVKWLELLKQIAPGIARVVVIYYPATASWAGYLSAIEAGVPSLGVHLSKAAVRDAAEIERAIGTFAGEPNGGLIILPSPLTGTHRRLIVETAARLQVPAVYPFRFYVADGGLASYGTDNVDLYRRAAGYVDRILKGEKPGDLPVQQADKFELVINLKTAKALGLEVPISLLARTDEVIE